MNTVTCFHPSTAAQFESRNQLLQQCLRGDLSPGYSIAEEYPLVLSPHTPEYSLCLQPSTSSGSASGAILAHLNLWPRVVLTSQGASALTLGLVGNVAVHPAFRQQGLARRLFDHAETQARQQGISHLVLWSDEKEFYKKLGFQEFGAEIRVVIKISPLARKVPELYLCEGPIERCTTLWSLRPETPLYLKRTPEELHALLSIPDTSLFVLRGKHPGEIEGFAVLGKGCDMVGVVHEWGAGSGESLFRMIQGLSAWFYQECHQELPQERRQNKILKELILLMPSQYFLKTKSLLNWASSWQICPMGWCKPLNTNALDLAKAGLFLWGLDSI